jgi:hypothetical protein
MSNCHCCKSMTSGSNAPADQPRDSPGEWRSPRLFHRSLHIVNWLAPGAILALLPKCPMCLAAYIVAVTGIGISMQTATILRTLLTSLCLVSLAYLATKPMRRAMSSRKPAVG